MRRMWVLTELCPFLCITAHFNAVFTLKSSSVFIMSVIKLLGPNVHSHKFMTFIKKKLEKYADLDKNFSRLPWYEYVFEILVMHVTLAWRFSSSLLFRTHPNFCQRVLPFVSKNEIKKKGFFFGYILLIPAQLLAFELPSLLTGNNFFEEVLWIETDTLSIKCNCLLNLSLSSWATVLSCIWLNVRNLSNDADPWCDLWNAFSCIKVIGSSFMSSIALTQAFSLCPTFESSLMGNDIIKANIFLAWVSLYDVIDESRFKMVRIFDLCMYIQPNTLKFVSIWFWAL